MKDFLEKELAALQGQGLLREMRELSSSPGRTILIDGKTCVNYSSNSYLGLHCHPRVKRAAQEAVERWGTSGTSSRLIAGTLQLHRRLEETLARSKKQEAALVFPSGYQTNAGVISALLSAGDCIIMDRLNHASLWDAAKRAGARVFVYRHCDVDDLEKVLRRARAYRRKLVVTDSIFSMDGDRAPLDAIAPLARRHGAWTMIDEAHATGIFGKTGGGLAEHFGVEDKIDIIMGTLSKALASQGGFVCGSRKLIQYLVNRSRSFIYTTSLAPASCAAALAALEVVHREPERRQHVLALARKLADRCAPAGARGDAGSQIVPLVIGPLERTVRVAQILRDRGIFAPAIRPPTVPEGECRLRFSLTSDHTEEDVRALEIILSEESEERNV